MPRTFGDIPGYPVGSSFTNRQELHDAGVHRPPMAGISGSESEGADSIVVSGGYEDDEDMGDVIVYTGHGGNNLGTHRQVADQTLTLGNLALAKSNSDGLPVRVIRGAGGDLLYSPTTGYRYDGLYYVDKFWSETGRSGFRIWRFRLIKQPDTPSPQPSEGTGNLPRRHVHHIETIVQRVVGSTSVVQQVKRMHDYTCQICSTRIETPAGPYAEGVHIRPLGRPHDGPDTIGNILCLCPNDHVRFDYGSIVILDDCTIVGHGGTKAGVLRLVKGHVPDRDCLAYHREHFKFQ